MRIANAFESFRPTQLSVTAFGQTWDLLECSAYEWIGAVALSPQTLAGVFPGMCADEDVEALLDLSFEPDFATRCSNAARVALGRAAGKDWWWAQNLITHIISGWPFFNGVMLREGMRAKDHYLADFLDATYTVLYERADDEGRMKLEVMLKTLPKGVGIRQTAQDRKEMMQAFAAD